MDDVGKQKMTSEVIPLNGTNLFHKEVVCLTKMVKEFKTFDGVHKRTLAIRKIRINKEKFVWQL